MIESRVMGALVLCRERLGGVLRHWIPVGTLHSARTRSAMRGWDEQGAYPQNLQPTPPAETRERIMREFAE